MKNRFIISLVNHPDWSQQDDPSQFLTNVSIRRTRALKLARRLRKEGNPNIMLWDVKPDGSKLPVRLKHKAHVVMVGAAEGSKFQRRSLNMVTAMAAAMSVPMPGGHND